MNNPNLDLMYQIYLKSFLKLPRSYIKSPLKHHYNREEKCDVTFPWWQNFWMTTIGSFCNGYGEQQKNNRFRFRGSKRIHDIVRKEKGT